MREERDSVFGGPGGGAEELALLLSCAVQIEPTLIRAIRLELAPRYDVSAEADLWFSDWVGTRSADSIRLRSDIVTRLRERLAARLAADPHDAGWRLWKVLSEVHVGQPAALVLEEQLTWTAVRVMAGAAEPTEIDDALRPALRAVVLEHRPGVSDWFAAAWHRLPSAVHDTVTAWQLLQSSTDREIIAPLTTEARLDLPDVFALGDLIADTTVSVRHDGVRLYVNEREPAGGHRLPVPDTRPQVLQVRWDAVDGPRRQILRVDPNQPQSVLVGPASVRVQNGRGFIYAVDPELTVPSVGADGGIGMPSVESDAPSLDTAEELRSCALAVRRGRRRVDDQLVAAIESEVQRYRESITFPRPNQPSAILAELLPLMGWLISEASWDAVQRVAPGYVFLAGQRREESEIGGHLVRRLSDAARALPWPEYAPRALTAIRAEALTESKQDTEDGYDGAWILHQEARNKITSFTEAFVNEPDSAHRLALDEVLLELAVAEAGTASRIAERVISRWSEGVDSGEWTTDHEHRWIQRLFRQLSDGLAIAELALDTASRIDSSFGLVHAVDEYRLTLVTAFRVPAILAAGSALLMLALSPVMERLGQDPYGMHPSWNGTRTDLLARVEQAYRTIERPVLSVNGTPIPLSQENARSVVQLRLALALLAPGYSLPTQVDFDPCMALDPLDEYAVEALSAWLAAPIEGQRRGDGQAIGSATMPIFIASVDACRASFGVTSGYREWRRRWFALDRYADDSGRLGRVETAVDDQRDIDAMLPADSPLDAPSRRQAEPRPRRPDYGTASAAVRRVLARDDLLSLASAAEAAVGIVRQRESLVRAARDEASLFQVALDHHLRAAGGGAAWAIKAQALDYAGVIVEFCSLVGIALDAELDADELYERALGELHEDSLESTDLKNSRDTTLAALTTYRRARSLRLRGQNAAALHLLNQPAEYFIGIGAEPILGHFVFEIGANLIVANQAAQALGQLAESDESYWHAGRAPGYTTRHRREFILGLAAWEQADRAEADQWLSMALDQSRAAYPDGQHHMATLSLTLTLAELMANRSIDGVSPERAVTLARQALSIAEQSRSRWQVIGTARSPMSVAFQRLYGDIARLAATIPGQRAAFLGLEVCLSAKQTMFASLLRTDRNLLTNRIGGLLDDIVREENSHGQGLLESTKQDRKLDALRFELKQILSPMLADTVLPGPTNVVRVLELVGDRYALDYVGVPDTLTGTTAWFRALIRPGGGVEFDRLELGGHLRTFFDRDDRRAWTDRIYDVQVDWRGLGLEVLPLSLLDELGRTTDQPVELLISPHGRLSLMPWPALQIDEGGTRLIERAIIAQTPTLAALTGSATSAVAGPALVRLVGRSEGGVNTEPERRAWDMAAITDDRTALSNCAIGTDDPPAELADTLAGALAHEPNRWQFAHIAAHGSGIGLAQVLHLPEALSAGQALALRWPRSVLMTSSYVGAVTDDAGNEQVGFVTAMLVGGSQCVVAAIDNVPDEPTGRLAATIVAQIRAEEIPLDAALRRAQLMLSRDLPESAWALFAAFKR